MGLVYKDYKQIHDDTTTVETFSNVLIDDPPALLNFTLTKAQVALILYSPTHHWEDNNNYRGHHYAIELDGVDVAEHMIYGSGFQPNAHGAEVVYLGILDAGPHVVKGRFCNLDAGQRATLSERYLTVILFDGSAADFSYVRTAATPRTTNSDVLINDPNSTINLNLASQQKALILYSVSGAHAGGVTYRGLGIAVQVDGVDSDEQFSNVPYYVNNNPAHAFIALLRTLGPGAHTLQGRYRRAQAADTARMDETQFAVLLFDTSLKTDSVEDDTTTITMSGENFADDTPALINRNLSEDCVLLAFYCWSMREGGGITYFGAESALNLDGSDYWVANRANPTGYYSFGFGGHLLIGASKGSHTVKGRFCQTHSAPTQDTAVCTQRTLMLLWFVGEAGTPPPEAFQHRIKKEESKPFPPHDCSRLRVLHRTTRLIPWIA